ncbi:CapA family protein [Marinoscillum sp.]|uniref:CapA family protein n=1 Tax=Marinoscillum sp. TaxID=2024838 RepID=UPI003BA9E7DE
MKYYSAIVILTLLLACSKKTVVTTTTATADTARTKVAVVPLILMNDTIFHGSLEDIDRQTIGEMDLIRDTVESVSRYGAAGRNGAVILYTKDYLTYLDSIENHVDSLKLQFVGDVMGHNGQINSAYNSKDGSYDYNPVFQQMKPLFERADYTLANLEVTLAGAPYAGYPEFSSPDELAIALKENGVDGLVTANNHSCDLGGPGLVRTIRVLDSLQMDHTGTFLDSADRAQNNLLIIDKNNIRVGVLNYTYGTNYLPNPPPTLVNRIDSALILNDLKDAKLAKLDKLIAFMHWGKEYQHEPNTEQLILTSLLFDQGVDIIIGSHPHVLQKMQWIKTSDTTEYLVCFSLGNFVSDQRTAPRDGGAIFELDLQKKHGETHISNTGYYLTWVHKYRKHGKNNYEVLPAASFETNPDSTLSPYNLHKMQSFLKGSRALLDSSNIGIRELKYVSNDPLESDSLSLHK